jgi:heme/copper-type cytochrome/quinol oxidase subunit 3
MESKTMMKLLVGTESMFFLCLIMAFIYLAVGSGFEPGQQQALNIRSTGLFSVALFCSSGSFWLAERNYNARNFTNVKRWLFVTIALGVIFLFGQAREYVHLIHEQQIGLSNSLFGTAFYTLTGFHGLHVIIGLVILSVLLFMTIAGDFNHTSSPAIATAGIYWHFVDLVWVMVFTVVYILPRLNLLK